MDFTSSVSLATVDAREERDGDAEAVFEESSPDLSTTLEPTPVHRESIGVGVCDLKSLAEEANQFRSVRIRLALRYVRNYAVAQDMVQEAMLKLVRTNFGNYDSRLPLQPFLAGASRTCALNFWRGPHRYRWINWPQLRFLRRPKTNPITISD